MGTVGEGLKAFNWATERIDMALKWLKKKGRENEIKSIDKAIANNDAKSVERIVRRIEKERYKRTSAS